ncbi:DnaD domain protein [Virgibacillus halodenitrificans]|uniref:DnaD domain-containing protein n=1 Tax=Virgibacillus halodenitrificans TaxID=1482 RepID=UPI00136F469E|nr:DnaD domain protein [Virgibacillus halodenitrificans]MYL44618.1 DnaD domain protein [Virgibacillus halodenitrificans]
MNGWIKLHRKMLTSNIFQNEKLLKIFTYCLLKATHTEHQQVVGKQKVDLKPGQFVFGRRKAALELDMKESTVRDYMKVLKDDNVIAISPTNKFSVITVINWEIYQSKDDSQRQQNDNKMTPEGQQNDTNKNVKNDKELFSSSIEQEFYEVMNFYQANLQRGVTESPFNHELIGQWFDEWGSGLLLASMKVAAKAEAKGVNMVEGILKNWKEAGVKTVEDARKYEMEFKAKKPNNTIPFKPKRPKEAEDDGYNYGF